MAQLGDTPWPKFHYDLRNTGKTANFGTTVGKLKWKFVTGAAVTSSPALDSNGILYIGSADNNFYAINAETGAIEWKYTTGGAIEFSSPAIDINGVVYIGSNDGYLYAFDTTTIDSLDPQPKWKYSYSTPPLGAISSPPTIDESGNILFASNDGYLYSITTSGTFNWRERIEASWSCPALDTDLNRVYIGSWKPTVGTYNPIIDGVPSTDLLYGFKSFYAKNIDTGSDVTFTYVTDNGSVITTPWLYPDWRCVPGGIQASPV
ncbi:MAG: PQQ-like beta-propeller repeat protein, partial [Deltaproteobacteria bacterium]|nr:PQQ-like beta-propeller repeat protein [Deltaproteobacteria bacterium]